MSKSDHLENAVLDAVLNNISLAVVTPYMSLHTADPGESGGNEASGGSYARQAVSFGAAAAGSCSNDAAVSFDFSGYPSQVTITHFALYDAATAGNLLYSGSLAVSKTLDPGDTLTFAAGEITISED